MSGRWTRPSPSTTRCATRRGGVYDFTTTLAPLTELPPFFRVTMDAMSKRQEWTDRMLGLIGGVVEDHEIYAPDALERLYDDAGVPQDQRIYDPAG
ncbi:hypothetical protein ACW23B_00675 [Streptomyces albidoflavus]